MRMIFSLSPNTIELDAVRIAQPKHILISYPRWRNWKLPRLFERIGYVPHVTIDSGAFTYFKAGASVNYIRQMEDLYTAWLTRNRKLYDMCLPMDSFVHPLVGMYSYMRLQYLRCIPVIHMDMLFEYGVEWYLNRGAKWIALGGSARQKDKDQPGEFRKRVLWANHYITHYPNARFHLLGTQDTDLIYRLPGLGAVDGTTWIQAGRYRALNGEDRLSATVDEIRKREAFAALPVKNNQLSLL